MTTTKDLEKRISELEKKYPPTPETEDAKAQREYQYNHLDHRRKRSL